MFRIPRWFWPLVSGFLLGLVFSYLAARSLMEVTVTEPPLLWMVVFWVFASPVLGFVTVLGWLLPVEVLPDLLVFLPIWLFYPVVCGLVLGIAATGRRRRAVITLACALLLVAGLAMVGNGLLLPV